MGSLNGTTQNNGYVRVTPLYTLKHLLHYFSHIVGMFHKYNNAVK